MAWCSQATHRNPGTFQKRVQSIRSRSVGISMLCRNHILQCGGKIFCVALQRCPLKYHTIYITHTLHDGYNIQMKNWELVNVIEMVPWAKLTVCESVYFQTRMKNWELVNVFEMVPWAKLTVYESVYFQTRCVKVISHSRWFVRCCPINNN